MPKFDDSMTSQEACPQRWRRWQLRVGGVFLLLEEAAVACWRRISTVREGGSCVLEAYFYC